jgi:proteasome lid subunit RPN8/RPN11
MRPTSTLAFTGITHDQVKHHLFPGDGLEAAALLVCTRTPGPRLRLLVRDVIPVPHAVCANRQRDTITWPGEYLEAAIDHAESEGLAIVIIHSHPGGLFAFSDADDQSDQRVLPCLFQACGDVRGAAIMTPDGAIRARFYRWDMRSRPVELVTVSEHDISYWWERDAGLIDASTRPAAFTSMMTEEGVVTLLKEEHENSASRIFSNDRDCLVPYVHSRRTKGSVCLCRNEMALDVESVVGGCVS